MPTTQKAPQNVGVINPYALAEVMMKKRVNWKRIADPRALLEKTLGLPYEKMFDPKNDSPLYAGLVFHRETQSMARAEVKATASPAHRAAVEVGAAPVWADPGDFFEEASEMTDPVQGALGDCYFIAALSSVAWARTYVIAQRSRATGTGQQQCVDMIELFKQGVAQPDRIEVSELLPLNSPGNIFIYARSCEAGEIWPAVYEKAYAKWRTNDAGDKPNYAPIAGGDPVGACFQLTGLTPNYLWNSGLTPDAIWQKVRENSVSMKTFNPMVAWTYPSGDASPDKVNYDNAHLVANHAYSIFGWQYANNKKYLILRNPWGTWEANLNPEIASWVAWDAPYYGGKGWWRPISMATNDGIFALEASAFKKYFAGFGFVK